jgi:hypothetical protein
MLWAPGQTSARWTRSPAPAWPRAPCQVVSSSGSHAPQGCGASLQMVPHHASCMGRCGRASEQNGGEWSGARAGGVEHEEPTKARRVGLCVAYPARGLERRRTSQGRLCWGGSATAQSPTPCLQQSTAGCVTEGGLHACPCCLSGCPQSGEWEPPRGRHSGRHGERDTVGDTVRETQWETRRERHSGRHGEGDTVGDTVRETQWETRRERHSGRHGERDTVGDTVRETQWETR